MTRRTNSLHFVVAVVTMRIIALGTSASASGGNVSRGGQASVLSDAVPLETGSYPLSASGW